MFPGHRLKTEGVGWSALAACLAYATDLRRAEPMLRRWRQRNLALGLAAWGAMAEARGQVLEQLREAVAIIFDRRRRRGWLSWFDHWRGQLALRQGLSRLIHRPTWIVTMLSEQPSGSLLHTVGEIR